MTNFKAKMHQFPAGEAYSAPPDPKLDLGAASRQGEGLGWEKGGKGGREGEEGEVEGSEREGPELLLNQGPSQPCYMGRASSL